MTKQEAEQQIKKLQKFIAEKEQEEIPKPLDNPDFTPLIELAQAYIDDINNDKYCEDDAHYIFERAMECVFGKKVWGWINKNI